MDLSTTYLGLDLKHPIVPSASPLSRSLDGIRQLEDAGASAVVMYSLFEEQLELESLSLHHYLTQHSDSFAEATSYLPELGSYNLGPEPYLNLLSSARRATDIPIIGSLNGHSPGGWTEHARQIEQAGADALELNIYFLPTEPYLSGASVEMRYLEIVEQVRRAVRIPVAVKLSPYFSSTAHMAMQFSQIGADGLVLFNRFYQPDFDLETLEATPALHLSDSFELRLPLRWVALLYGRVPADLAITGGVHTHLDAIKGLMAGARVTMLASELLERGPGRIAEIVRDMSQWLEAHEYGSVRQLQGSMSAARLADPTAFERANYLRVLDSWRPAMAQVASGGGRGSG